MLLHSWFRTHNENHTKKSRKIVNPEQEMLYAKHVENPVKRLILVHHRRFVNTVKLMYEKLNSRRYF
ncbi:hypothetical protein JW868_02065 [Candidatus Woesearchaeota archaeon]|nr:hypothetical protein [Candidatus Woesearchaeota archaeon]